MEMHQVRYFLAMARLLNFTRAAEECNVSQPSLTRAIQKLEDEFGGPLFRRERSRTHLTDLGRMMQPHLERTFEGAQTAKALARGVNKAQVAPLALGVASSIESATLDGVLAELAETLSGFELTIHGSSSRELIKMALSGALDLVIVEAPDDAPDRLDSWPLFEQGYRMVVRAIHPMASRDLVAFEDIKSEHWIDCGGDGFARARRVAEDQGITLDVRHHANDGQQLKRLILAGFGCAYTVDPAVGSPLKGIRIKELDDSWPVLLASIAGRRRSVAGEAFVRASRARSWYAASAA
jgi:DNA-binding transcriptional LysR family regulator